MPVTLGARPEHGFDQPLGLLSDCHRRIESFLGMMIRVLEQSNGGRGPLTREARAAMAAALRYFDVAAPRHTQDEEQSLFPRLRASDDPDAHAVLQRIESLEVDHRHAEAMHEEVNRLCRKWLDAGSLEAEELRRLGELLGGLRATYARHIALEDTELFPLAARVLDRRQLAEVGREMARRRGVAFPEAQS